MTYFSINLKVDFKFLRMEGILASLTCKVWNDAEKTKEFAEFLNSKNSKFNFLKEGEREIMT